jgi:hypothetical protein
MAHPTGKHYVLPVICVGFFILILSYSFRDWKSARAQREHPRKDTIYTQDSVMFNCIKCGKPNVQYIYFVPKSQQLIVK